MTRLYATVNLKLQMIVSVCTDGLDVESLSFEDHLGMEADPEVLTSTHRGDTQKGQPCD